MNRLPAILLCSLPVVAFAAPADLRGLADAARHIVGEHQGVYVEAADGSVLVAQAEASPVHPASVSKVATTLALLRKFGCDYRFTTTFAATGAVRDGTWKVTSWSRATAIRSSSTRTHCWSRPDCASSESCVSQALFAYAGTWFSTGMRMTTAQGCAKHWPEARRPPPGRRFERQTTDCPDCRRRWF